jgi:hypothetical protein
MLLIINADFRFLEQPLSLSTEGLRCPNGDVLIPCGCYRTVTLSRHVWWFAAAGTAVANLTVLMTVSCHCAAVGNLWVLNHKSLSYCGVIGYVTFCSGWWVRTSRKRIVPATLNMESVYPSGTLVPTYQTIRCQPRL